DQAVSLRQGQAGWAETISKMVNLGAQGSEDDLNTILNYLVKFYGPVGGPSGPTAGAAGRSANITTPTDAASPTPPGSLHPKTAVFPSDGAAVDPAKEWRTYGHDTGAMRFSPLKQIRPD